MLKVAKFGGSSMADAGQYRKVRDIILADPHRKAVVVSAAGKRFSADHKLTDVVLPRSGQKRKCCFADHHIRPR